MIGDQTFHLIVTDFNTLEQPLRHLHRALGGEAEFATGFLRQRGCCEGRRRPFDTRLLFNGRHRPRDVGANGLDKRGCLFFPQQPRLFILQRARLRIEVLAGGDALITETDQRRDELASLAFEPRLEIPIHRGVECAPLFFTLDDQADSDALHAARAESGLHFLPEQRRERVAIETIENAPALLRSHEVLVHVGRILERVLDGLFRDLVKHDAPDRDLWLEDFFEVPADRLAFAVRVRREQQLGGVLDGRLQMRDLLSFVRRDDVVGREVLFHVDAKTPPLLVFDFLGNLRSRLREIPYVTVARLDPVFVPEETAKNLRLGGRFDDDEWLRCQTQ